MIRRVVIAAVLAASLVAATSSHAASAGKICPTFKLGGLKVQWETAGTGWSCTSAKTWVVKLMHDHVKPAPGNVPLKNGPRGFHCFAVFEKKGLVAGGLCYLGTLAYPKSGFTWNGN
jgi:hypothetical protein